MKQRTAARALSYTLMNSGSKQFTGRTSLHWTAAAAVLVALTIQLPLRAQDFDIMSRWAQGNMIQQNLRMMLDSQARGGAAAPAHPRPGVSRSSGASGSVAPHAVSTAYRADPAVTARVQRQFVEFIRKTSGDAGAREMQQLFAQKDLLHLWASSSASDGMKLGDMADALTEYWVSNWQAANRRPESPSPAAYRAVRAQVQAVFASNPALARLNDAQRQELSEIYIYNMIVQGEGYMQASRQHDRALLDRISDAAETRFRNEMHLELRQLTLDDSGFRLKSS